MTKNENYIRGKIVAICEATLAEEMGIIAASRRLSALGLELFDGRHADFVTFDAIDSETDHLPVDTERKNWSSEALERKDREIAEAEAFYKNDVFAACRQLIERFAIRDGFTVQRVD
ncbi:MAG TPA: DUF2489 domain-containing protein [Pyrinomonadaceae bacterium]